MADENVNYSFTGDVSSLRQSVQESISLLNKYGEKMTFTSKQVDTTYFRNKKAAKDCAASTKSSLSAISDAFSRSASQSKSFGSSLNALTSATDLLKKTLGMLTGIKLGDWLAQGTKESIKFVENLNLFKVALGDSADMGMRFVDSMSELYGMDPSNLYRYTGYFYQLTDAIGMADESSSVLSLSLTKSANDIASLFNVDIETVVNNLASGMQGMTRAVRKYGIDIRTVTLQQTALNYGITQHVTEMSEADRQALRYLTIMDQVKNATQQVVDPTLQASGVMGDFARNIETPANQLRIFKEQITQLGRAIGNFFIPMISTVLPYLNGLIMALRTVLTFLFALTGFKMNFGGASTGASKFANALTGVGNAAKGTSKALKELKKTIAPFDEINLLNAPPSTSSGGVGSASGAEGLMNPALMEAIQNTSLGLEDIKMKANQVRDKLLEFFGFNYVDAFNPETGEFEKKLQWFSEQFRKNLIDKFPYWTKTINALFDNWTPIIEGFKKLFASIGGVIDAVKKKVKTFIDSLHLDEKFAEGIESLPDKLNGLSSWIDEHQDQIANFILVLGGLFAAFRVFKGVGTFLKPLIAVGSKIAPVIAQFSSFIGIALAVVSVFALLYTSSDSFSTSIQNLFQTLVASLQPIAGTVSEVATSIWGSLQQLWEEHLQPMFAQLGDALAPVIDTISWWWENVISPILQEAMRLLGTLWTGVLAPIVGFIADAIGVLAGIFQWLWETVLSPIIEKIGADLPSLFEKLQPIFEKVGHIISGLIEIISWLWNHVLGPLMGWLLDTFGPGIASFIGSVWDTISPVIDGILSIIGDVLTSLEGVIEFLTGVFSGDWDQAWEGIKKIFSGAVNSIISVAETMINVIISGINSLISFVWNSLQGWVNGILSAASSVTEFLFGYTIEARWDSPPPAIGLVSLPRVELASGGVVTGPTAALIGEGRYDEAVIPLGNSPQMSDFADQIASRIDNAEQVSLLREQNQLLRQLLEQSGDAIGIQDLTGVITRIQRREARAGGY